MFVTLQPARLPLTTGMAFGPVTAGGPPKPRPLWRRLPSATPAGQSDRRRAGRGADRRQDHTNRETAARLYLLSGHVNTHLRHAFAKLGIHSRVKLARVGLGGQPDGDGGVGRLTWTGRIDEG